MDTAAETLVRAADNDQRLGAITLQWLGLGALEDGVGGLSERTGSIHGSCGAGELGGRHDLHRLGDLFDVANRLEAALDFTEGGISGGIGGSERYGPRKTAFCQYVMQLQPQWMQRVVGVEGEKLGKRARAYRAAAMPALRAGRAARDSILAGM